MNKIILAMVTVVTVFAGSLSIFSSVQSVNAEEVVAYLPTVTASGKTLSFEVPSSNIGTRSIQMDLGVPYSDTEMGRYLNTSGKSWTFENASLETPVLVRARQWVQLSTADGVRHLYSSWSDWFVLPYDGAVSSSEVSFRLSLGASSELRANCTLPSSDYTLYYVVPSRTCVQAKSGYTTIFGVGGVSGNCLVLLVCASDSGFGDIVCSRMCWDLSESMSFNYKEKKIIFDSGIDLSGYLSEGYSVKYLLECGANSSATLERKVLDGPTYDLPADWVPGARCRMIFSFYGPKVGIAQPPCYYEGYSGMLNITQDMIDGIDPNPPVVGPDPDNTVSEPPVDGGTLFDQINALGEPWNILIYIAGGCLIVMALGALFGRR